MADTTLNDEGRGTIRTVSVTVTTDGSGDATAYLPAVTGYLYSIQYTKTDYADTADFTITNEATGQGIWTQANVTASAIKYPRFVPDGLVGVALAALTVAEKPLLLAERIKIVVAQGGTTKTGVFTANIISL